MRDLDDLEIFIQIKAFKHTDFKDSKDPLSLYTYKMYLKTKSQELFNSKSMNLNYCLRNVISDILFLLAKYTCCF